jgi:thiamine biosynthesis lipoprotein
MYGTTRAADCRGRLRATALAVLVLLAGSACRDRDVAEEIQLRGEALGTTWAVTFVGPSAPEPSSLRERVEKTLDRVDRGMSTWRDDAEIVRFNRRSGAGPFLFTAETRRVVAAALEMSRETGGAFDPTVGPLVALWGFGPGARNSDPAEAELERARARVGWQHLRWDERGGLASRVPGVGLDLSAIAKGYAVDAIADELTRDRPAGLLVEIGGEVRALGAKPGGEPWRLGITDPVDPESFEAVVYLTGGALATSGDYRQARIVDGERRSHVLDPRTGRPTRSGVASASVVAPTCMEADAVATALMVLGPDAALAFVEDRPWLEALLLVREADRIAERRASSGWERRVAPGR